MKGFRAALLNIINLQAEAVNKFPPLYPAAPQMPAEKLYSIPSLNHGYPIFFP